MWLYILIFMAGGFMTLLVTIAEASGHHYISEIAALFPTITFISYIFLGTLTDNLSVSRHAQFVLLGTLIAWVPYMITIWLFAPKIGTEKALCLGLVVFTILSFIFTKIFSH